MPLDAQVPEQSAAAAALDPLRAQILALLAEPGSASTIAHSLGLPRQKVNYHLRLLEEHQLVELVEESPRRGLTELVVRATARGYVVSPSALVPAQRTPSVLTDSPAATFSLSPHAS
ncbi:MAG: winged helix-turn-helix domain-containing protein [Ornithinimicrobium sp.]